MSSKAKKVTILGFGFSGLSAAWAYQREGYEVEVFEKHNQVGGLLQTQTTEYGLIEGAANAILKSKSVEQLARDIDLKWAPRKETIKYKWVYTDRPRRWPLSLMQTLKSLKPLVGLAMCKPTMRPEAGESVSAWGSRTFRNDFFVNQLLGPALQGVYAQGPEQLSASLSLKSLFDKNRVRTQGSHAPTNGMCDFFVLGLKYLKAQANFQIHLNSPRELSQVDSEIIIDTRPDYRSVKYLSVTSVTLFFNQEDRPSIRGFGCLFAGEKVILGVLFNSDIFEGRSVNGLFSETWIVAEEYKEDRETVEEVLSFREKKFRLQARPVYYKVNPWPLGIPNYDTQHERFLQNEFNVESMSEGRKLIKLANYTGDIGLNKILEKAVRFAQR